MDDFLMNSVNEMRGTIRASISDFEERFNEMLRKRTHFGRFKGVLVVRLPDFGGLETDMEESANIVRNGVVIERIPFTFRNYKGRRHPKEMEVIESGAYVVVCTEAGLKVIYCDGEEIELSGDTPDGKRHVVTRGKDLSMLIIPEEYWELSLEDKFRSSGKEELLLRLQKPAA